MPSVSFVSVIRALPSASAARSIGMWCTERTPGNGTCTPMDFMLMRSLHSVIRCGGIGDTIPMVPAGVGDGLVLTMDGVVTIPVTGVAGTVAGMPVGMVVGMAAIGVITGDTIMAIIPDGVAAIIGETVHIPTVVRMDRREGTLLCAVQTVYVRKVYAEGVR